MRSKRLTLGRRLGRAAALAGVAASLSACGGTRSPADGTPAEVGTEVESQPEPSAEQFDAAVVAPGTSPTSADPTGGAWRLIEVPAASNQPSIVRTPSGWLALSTRSVGDARALNDVQSALYRSSDGVHWRSIPLDPGHADLMLQGLAYGAGRYVMLGRRLGGDGGGVIWTSSNAEHWQEKSQELDYVYTWRRAAYAGGRFFGFGWTLLGVSETGEAWRSVQTSNVQPMAIAYGGGRYLLAGSGPEQVSADGLSWQERNIDCALPGACISDPSGGVHQGVQSHALFAEGRFYIDELSAASDGTDWQSLPGRIPAAYVGGRFLGSVDLNAGLNSWTPDGALQTLRLIRPTRAAVTTAGRELGSVGVLDREAPLPEVVNVEFEDGLDCTSARCVLVDQRLVLIPPPGTAPLPDRVPRRSDGSPLLSDGCPVSSMIFCADYALRSGCQCRREAPRGPASCEDVSQYRCEGELSVQGHEWQLPEVAQAGCSCDAVDPNQPPSFGRSCSPEGSECTAPLGCLPIETPPSPGPPAPERTICTSACTSDADCPTWQATGFCAGSVQLRCARGACQPRSCP